MMLTFLKLNGFLTSIELEVEQIICLNCGDQVVQYHNEQYCGKRGLCQTCGANFPLE